MFHEAGLHRDLFRVRRCDPGRWKRPEGRHFREIVAPLSIALKGADHGFFRDNFFLTRSGLDGIWAHGKAVHIAGFAEFFCRSLL